MGSVFSYIQGKSVRLALLTSALLALAACEDGQMPAFMQPKDQAGSESAGGSAARNTSERDVEAPEVFQAKEAGLWDGRPSLGGVWVAHPDVKDPERVIVRNDTNGKFVIGALFRRERETPGPRLQISSDAAAALGILAGQPTNLDVVALRREEVAVEAPAPEATAEAVPAAADVSSAPLDPVAETAAAPIAAAAAAPKPAPKPAKSSLSKPYIQIGIFSVEQNAKNTATAMRTQGMVPTIKTHSSKGKTFYRVLVGPAQTSGEISALKKKIRAAGFADAYAVSG